MLLAAGHGYNRAMTSLTHGGLICLISSLLAAGCGQKGPLYLPEQSEEEAAVVEQPAGSEEDDSQDDSP